MRIACNVKRGGAAVAAALALITALGCASDTPTSTVTTRNPAQASATIDGTPWAANFQINLAVADWYPADQRMEINALELHPDSSGRQLSIVLKPFTGPGTYVLGPHNATASPLASSAYFIASPNVTYKVDSSMVFASARQNAGTVTVTDYDASARWISGTFTLEAAQTNDQSKVIHITNGTFDGRIAPGT
ncbi:MAG TPA: DUF6252 family protein [Gemmatimonadaceae bacterium]|nr:DUF6252 family protein [Gemmatimonadaceae bacterium]